MQVTIVDDFWEAGEGPLLAAGRLTQWAAPERPHAGQQ
jgi:hypothetical protein